MNISSPKKASTYLAISCAICIVVVFVINWLIPVNITIYVYAVEMVVSLVVIFFVAKYFFNHFIIEKINPLYKTIHNVNISGKELLQRLENSEILPQMRRDVFTWVEDKAKEIDQLKQLEKYRREFLGNVSHELKTPIFNIQGYILTLLDGGLEDRSINRLYLERAEKSINRMINIIEDLESISRLESGELKLSPELFNIVGLVAEVFEYQEMLAKKYQIKLALDSGGDKPIWVSADRQRITEVINNLIVNSVKYGKKGGKTTVSFIDIGDQVIVEVTDTGIGIHDRDIPRIFERFYRTDKSRSRDQGGTGLGLSIVKHIIEAHGQTIRVRSKLGEGSTFSFTLNKEKIKT